MYPFGMLILFWLPLHTNVFIILLAPATSKGLWVVVVVILSGVVGGKGVFVGQSYASVLSTTFQKKVC